MKYASTIRRISALAAVAASVCAPIGAHAESQYVQGTGPLTASAKLDFQIVVDKFIFLQVGTGATNTTDATVNKQTFTIPGGTANGNGTPISGGAAVTTAVRGNAGQLTLANNGSGTLGNGGATPDTIDMASITPVVTGTVPHAGWGVASTLPTVGASNVTKLDGTWAFNYANANVVAAGTYTKQVTYTLTSL